MLTVRLKKLIILAGIFYLFTVLCSVLLENAITSRKDYVQNTDLEPRTQWYTWRRVNQSRLEIWPHDNPFSDRIHQQLFLQPKPKSNKSILLFDGFHSWGVSSPAETFSKCPVSYCTLVEDINIYDRPDAVVFKSVMYLQIMEFEKPPNQIWVMYMLESPAHRSQFPLEVDYLFNWTATYRTHSDIVTPYAKWVYYNESVKQRETPIRNYAAGKDKKVAWFVSNCRPPLRREYARQLSNYIKVDVFGKCGPYSCPKWKDKLCFEEMARRYKFYLSFENGNCKEYITEKFFTNGLGYDVLPIVMGARREDYQKVAPLNSYIHVDDFETPEALADYLHLLDLNDDLYNSYFLWKGLGKWVDTLFFCRLCALIHEDTTFKYYTSLNEWWFEPGVCIDTPTWRGIS